LEGAILPKLPVEILLGKKNLEVRPTSTNKVGLLFYLYVSHLIKKIRKSLINFYLVRER
jgi:hypothetical protein